MANIENLISQKPGSQENQPTGSGAENYQSVQTTLIGHVERFLGDLNSRRLPNLGRRCMPIKAYIDRSAVKMQELKRLSHDFSLSVTERRKYRAQLFALKRRVSIKVELLKRS